VINKIKLKIHIEQIGIKLGKKLLTLLHQPAASDE